MNTIEKGNLPQAGKEDDGDELLQEAIEEEHPTITVLMVHAQDTIMAVDSEIRLIRRLQKLYRNLACGKEEEG